MSSVEDYISPFVHLNDESLLAKLKTLHFHHARLSTNPPNTLTSIIKRRLDKLKELVTTRGYDPDVELGIEDNLEGGKRKHRRRKRRTSRRKHKRQIKSKRKKKSSRT